MPSVHHMSLRSVAVAAITLAACSDDVEITKLPGSPTATRALTFFDDGTPIAIGGDSEFGLAYLQTPNGSTWERAVDIPAFDANAKLLRGRSDIFAIGETQVHRWERANTGGGFAWKTIAIPFGTTANTAFGVDDIGNIFALELAPDGAGAVWSWRTDTNRWWEVPMTRPIGIGATSFTISESGNSLAWSVPGTGLVWVDRIADTRTELSCEEPALGACAATVRGLAMDDGVLHALVCDQEVNGLRTLVSFAAAGVGRIREFRDESCRSLARISYGTMLVVADSVHVVDSADQGFVSITDADPSLSYTLFDPSTAYAFGDGIYRIDF
jgi:hypothetical protein